MDKFLIEDENGLTKEANVITVFDYMSKRYILYAISKDENNDNILVSELVKDNDGYDTLKDIEENSIKEELDEVIKRVLKKEEDK